MHNTCTIYPRFSEAHVKQAVIWKPLLKIKLHILDFHLNLDSLGSESKAILQY